MKIFRLLCIIVFILKIGINDSFCQNKQDTLSWRLGLDISYPLSYNGYGAKSLIDYESLDKVLNRYSNKQDSIFAKQNDSLFSVEPSINNYHDFYELAISFWKLGKDDKAEQMFMKILNSDKDFYNKIYFYKSENDSNIHSKADTLVLIYQNADGYFTAKYKHNITLFLSEICIRNNDFDKALLYLNESKNKYKVEYNAHTYAYNNDGMYEVLYANCYKGLNQTQKIIDLLLPTCLIRNHNFLVDALKEVYTHNEIEKELNKAIKSINVKLNKKPTTTISYSIRIENGKKIESRDTLTYYSGITTIKIFDKPLVFSKIWSFVDLKNGEVLTRGKMIEEFKNYYIYKALMDEIK